MFDSMLSSVDILFNDFSQIYEIEDIFISFFCLLN